MDGATWHEALRVRVKSLYVTMRTLYEQVAPAGTFLVSATRLGGQHGYDEAGAVAPMGGAVTGFTKTYKRERTGRTGEGGRFRSRRATRREIADILIAGNSARSRRGRDRLQRRAALDHRPARTARRRRPARPDLGQEHRISDHRRGGQHRLGDHGRPGRGVRRNLLPARPGAGARSRTIPTSLASSATKTA